MNYKLNFNKPLYAGITHIWKLTWSTIVCPFLTRLVYSETLLRRWTSQRKWTFDCKYSPLCCTPYMLFDPPPVVPCR